MARHPYTYAADSLRQFCTTGVYGSCTMSRSESAQIRNYIAKVLGIDDEYLAVKLSEAYQKQTFGKQIE